MDIINTLLELTIFSGIIFIATMLLKKFQKDKMSPLLHYVVWLVLIVRLMVPVTITSPVHFLVIPSETNSQIAAEQVEPNVFQAANVSETEVYDMDVMDTAPVLPSADRQTVQNRTEVNTPAAVQKYKALTLSQIIIIIWLAGMGICLAYLSVLFFALRKKFKRNAQYPSKRLIALLEEVKAEMGIKSDIRLVCQYEYGTPALMFPRTILMPVDALVSMNDEQTKFALRHELMHYRRGDHMMSILLSLLNAVYWFNPFVWLAFRQIRTDMEIACDGAVVKSLSDSVRTRYASLVVSLFSQPTHRQLVLGMAQANARKIAEQRVRGIFMKGKSKRSVKLISALLAGLLLVTCFTTACQPTPETPPVVNKGDGKLKDTIEQSAAPDEKYSAPGTWQDELKREGSTLTVKIDAAVNVPDADRYPVVEIGPANFTQSEVDHLVDYFTDGAPLYEIDLPMTKAEYQERILEVQAELAMADNPDADLPPKEEIEALLADLQRKMQEAPESVDRKPVDGKLTIGEDMDYETMEAAVYLEGEEPAQIRVNNTSDTFLRSGFSFDNGIIYQPQKSLEGQQAQGQNMTPQEAMAAVDAMLGELELTDMRAVSVATGVGLINNFTPIQEDKQGYIVTCKRFVNDIPVTEAEVRGGGGGKEIDEAIADGRIDEQQYAPYWSDGRIMVSIDDTGIRSFRWLNRGETGKVFNENVPLMPFDDIQKKFEQQIFASYGIDAAVLVNESGSKEDDPETITLDTIIDVYRIELGMVTIRQKDSMGSFVLVPAWTFFGKQTAIKPDGEPVVNVEDEMSGYISDSLLIINAIDGSVINQNSGF